MRVESDIICILYLLNALQDRLLFTKQRRPKYLIVKESIDIEQECHRIMDKRFNGERRWEGQKVQNNRWGKCFVTEGIRIEQLEMKSLSGEQ